MSIQRGSSYALPSPCWRYDVFLSFRGEDTRKNFTDHLYAALNQKGINVFRDDNELERGKFISPGLFKAIEDSRFSIIVFSKNYADSTWCLDELVKIVECKNTSEQIVFPIFYDVEPTVVRKQSGSFQEAFAKHGKAFGKNTAKVQKWQDALKKVANISGWVLKDRHEVEFIQEIVKEISRRLRPTTLKTLDDLIGINSRMEKLISLVDISTNDVRMIGICGMGGIGKTTIARAVYDLISGEFEGFSFLSNVREISKKGSLIPLQKQLLSEILAVDDINIYNDLDGMQTIKSRLRHKRVFVVIDDVVHVSQLNKLVGKHSWFGSRSRIIITTRDEHLLVRHRVNEVYKVAALDDDESLQLFSLKAFHNNQPSNDYVELTKRVLKYANGLPLALDVLGSFLYGRTVDEWKSSLERLNKDSEDEILDVLRISFDGLKETEQNIFLDIACFFKGKDRDYVTGILEGCGFNPVIGISVLIEKSLINVLDENRLWMHDLLQEMGHQIVKRQCLEEPGKRSRLWNGEDIHHLLTKNTGTKVIEGIMLDDREYKANSIADVKAFSKMTNLRLLKIHNVELPRGLEYFSNELRLLEWKGYPLKSLPSNLKLEKTVELNMCYSNIKQLWNTIQPLNNLKFMRFSYSQNFITTPDFKGVPNLEELILEGCTRLREIHPSLLNHKKVILLNLKGCTSLKTLPSKIAMESLRKLVLSGCSKLRKFPEIEGRMECLLELSLDGTAIKELPLSIELLSRLSFLDLNECKNLVKLPSTISSLNSLKTLKLSGCSKFENVPENLGKVESLEQLDIGGTAIRQPPSSIFHLKSLKALSFRGCKGPSTSTSTSWLWHFPINLMPRRSLDSMTLVLPSLSGLSSLVDLDLNDCNLGAIPAEIGNLLSLKELDLSKNSFVSLPQTIGRLSKLDYLILEDCQMLESLLELPSNIRRVRVDGCASLERASDAFKSCNSQFGIDSMNCFKWLGNNNSAFSMLKGFLEVEAVSNSSIELLNIVVPGSQIPNWFKYQNEGSTITIMRPPGSSYNKNNLVGYAFSSIFHVHKHPPKARKSFLYGTHRLCCRMEMDKIKSSTSYSFDFNNELGQAVSDHLWLFYLSNQELNHDKWNFESNHVKLSFRPLASPGLEVKSCGVHPIYVDEVEKFNKTTGEWTKSKVWKINEWDDQVSVGSKMDRVPIPTSKRSYTEYAEADANDPDEDPQPKRLKQLE